MRTIRLEILRPGPSDGYALSPLTQYIAICNDNPPESFAIPFDHRTLLGRLERLRYEIGASAKEADLREAAEIARRVLEGIHGFRTTLLNEVRRDDTVNVQLVLTAAELSLIPFELAYAPLALNGVAPLSVNSSARVSITRETRHFRGSQFDGWDANNPRVLFVVSAPDGVDVPERAHYYALRKALSYLLPAGSSAKREEAHLTWLRDATLEDIRKACARTKYSHIHILAHGSTKNYREQKYGIRLHSSSAAGGETVDGNSLALALQSHSDPARGTPVSPAVVTLAVCDSGNVGDVLFGDASVAHRLHEQDIPLVLASQFPMTFQGSAVFTETFYSAMLRGEDPRKVQWKVRDALYTRCPETHDWASLVTYATLPKNIATVSRKRELRVDKIELDEMMSALEARDPERVEPTLEDGLSVPIRRNSTSKKQLPEVEDHLQRFERRASTETGADRVSPLSTIGNAYKRLSIACRAVNRSEVDLASRSIDYDERAYLTRSCRAYLQMFEAKPNEPWILAQTALSELLVQYFELPLQVDLPSALHDFATYFCERRLESTTAPLDRVDIFAQQIELDLVHLVRARDGNEKRVDLTSVRARVTQYLRAVDAALAKNASRQTIFRLCLEGRQFRRYSYWFPTDDVKAIIGEVGEAKGTKKPLQLLPELARRGVDITEYMSVKDNE